MKKIFALLMLFLTLVLSGGEAGACTSAIITGKVTTDGRPLLWKHRDTDNENNRMAFFKGAKYDFLALVNSPDNDSIAWTGVNSAGFSIMNTASYNLKDDEITEMDMEGVLMYKALSECSSLADFEAFLNLYPRPMRVEANFGVIDAQGGAAYYEVNNTRWEKVDANDPKIAPNGYLIYTNFSYTGRFNEGMGYIRHQTASALIAPQAALGQIAPQWIFKRLSRSYCHSLMGIDLLDEACFPAKASGWVCDQDFIPRRLTSAVVVVQGVKPDEDPALTILWTILGYPPVGVAVPLWVKAGAAQPEIMLRSADSDHAPMCDWALNLKHRVFSLQRGNGYKYMNFALLHNRDGDGFMQRLAPVEQDVFLLYREPVERWRRSGINLQELQTINRQMEKKVRQAYAAL